MKPTTNRWTYWILTTIWWLQFLSSYRLLSKIFYRNQQSHILLFKESLFTRNMEIKHTDFSSAATVIWLYSDYQMRSKNYFFVSMSKRETFKIKYKHKFELQKPSIIFFNFFWCAKHQLMAINLDVPILNKLIFNLEITCFYAKQHFQGRHTLAIFVYIYEH